MDCVAYSIASKALSGANTTDTNTNAIDNTSDANKPVSTLQQIAIDGAGTAPKDFIASGALVSGEVVSLNSNGTVSVVTGSIIDAWIGISTQTVADTETAGISLYGGVNENQTGLTTQTEYFVDADGSLTTTDTGYPIGKAISSTKLLIEENS